MNSNVIKWFTIILGIMLLTSACEKDAEPKYVLPKDYLPAFPGSFWDYTNGERVITSQEYELHSYQKSINSTEETPEQYVPVYGGNYLYEYSIIQQSNKYPLKQLLAENVGGAWEVNFINNTKILRQVIEKKDSVIIPFPPFTNPIDSVIKDVVVVVEFLDSLGAKRWNTKEYYAKNIGLIKVEANNPFDTMPPVLIKQIQNYHINK